MTHPEGTDWEAQLQGGLDAVSDLGQEAPPRLESLQMLVLQVQREQKHATLRALALFWGVALVVLSGVLFTLSREPTYFLAGQVVVIVLLCAVAAAIRRKQVQQ